MAMDDMWHRRVPEGKTWRIPIVGLVPIVDAVVGVLVALAVGAAGVLIAAVQNHLGDLGSCDVIVVAGLAVVFFLRRRLPIASAAGVTLIWIVGTYVTPYMVNNWASTLAFFLLFLDGLGTNPACCLGVDAWGIRCDYGVGYGRPGLRPLVE